MPPPWLTWWAIQLSATSPTCFGQILAGTKTEAARIWRRQTHLTPYAVRQVSRRFGPTRPCPSRGIIR